MAVDARRRQKALARKAAKRKAKRHTHHSTVHAPRALPHGVSQWPLYEVVVSDAWDDWQHLAEVTVARRSPLGQIALGLFLVDLQCLGVKNAIAHVFATATDYQMFRYRQSPAQSVDLNLAAKIVHEGIAYAARFGFRPHPDYHQASVVLGDADPEACRVPIPLGGPEGKPLFVAGPGDGVDAIMKRLTGAVGADGFDYIVGLPLGADDELAGDDPHEADVQI